MILQTYDISLPAFVLPAAIAYFIPTTLSPVIQATIISLTGVVGVLANPVGGVVVAPLADRLGRRMLMILTNVGYTVIAAAVALLPGYAAWGYWAIGLLLFLRFLNGVCAASSPAGAIPMALERTGKTARGIIGALMGIGPTLGVILLTVVQQGSLGIAHTPAAFVQWGWRLPFWFGAGLGILETLITLTTSELEYFVAERQHRTHRRSSVAQVFSRRHIGIFIQAMVMYLGFLFLAANVPLFIPTLFITVLHMPPAGVNIIELWGNIGIVVGALILGAVGQRIGRRRGLLIAGIWITIVATPLFFGMIHLATHHGNFGLITLLGAAVLTLTIAPYSGMGLTYLIERYPLDIRAAGFGAVYSLSTVIPGFSSFYLLALRAFMPYQYTVLVLVAIAGILIVWGALTGPETNDVDLLAATAEHA